MDICPDRRGTYSSLGLKEMKYYLIGMKNWLLAVDYKLLISIMSTKDLEAIANPRITY